jgi:uncharacterized membrane protein YfcA
MRNEKKFGVYTIIGTVVMYIGYLWGSILPQHFLEGIFWCFLTTGMICMVLQIGER